MNTNIIKDIIGWDHINWGESLKFFDSNIDYNNINKVLELGAGEQSGGYSLFFAKKRMNVVCSTYEKISEKLIHRHNKYNFKKYISYEIIDAKNISYNEEFDIICFKSMLGGICKNDNIKYSEQVFNQIYKALKPNGYLVFSENISSTIIHKILRPKFVSKSWYYFSTNELVKLIEERFVNVNYTTTGFLGCFGRSEIQKNIIGYVDKYFFMNFIPKKWNYIFFGVCKKAPKSY